VSVLADVLQGFAHRDTREQAAAHLAKHLRCKQGVIFIPNVDTGALEPIGPADPHLVDEFPRRSVVIADDGTMLAALGGCPTDARLQWARSALPVIAAIIRGEQAQSRAHELYEEARDANRLRDDFLAMLSHELRTPLNAMLGWIQMLRLYDGDAAIRERALEVIERTARAQGKLVSDLLDVSRIVRGKLRLRAGRVDLRELVLAGCDSVRPSIDAKGLTLTTDLADVPGTVIGDSDRLQQVVWNLLSNAVKFTQRGGHIHVRLSATGDDAELAVIDSGIGIRADFLPHVFEHFRQCDATATRTHGGLGLGLAIVRHLVELHGGTVRASSAGEGHGATFLVTLPLRIAAANRESSVNREEQTA
jgi:signal transduction histidine kinase